MEDNKLPSSLSVLTFASARSKEIDLMTKCLAISKGTKMAFQKLPKHMRRRAMSHNVKRLPRRLREIHKSQMTKSGLPPKQKRPSRKYRRRPYNLTSDYVRRQQNHRWLNTHIWHAKRFHMVEKWGFKLPDRPCDRAFKACYRATTKHCLLQDISYFSCIELTGNFDVIVDNFKCITNKNAGLSMAAKAYSKGNREGSITLFQYDEREVHKAIGVINYNWRPIDQETKDNVRSVWLWVHAAFYREVLDNLIKCFKLNCTNRYVHSTKEVSSYSSENGIELKELREILSRFRLTGPLANAVVQNCFKAADLTGWVEKYSPKKFLDHQTKCWNVLNGTMSATSLSPHTILSLIVEDPRFNFPKKRIKAFPEMNDSLKTYRDVVDNVSFSPLWEETIRKDVTESKIPNSKINELRGNLLVPGSDLMEKGVPVPIMLVQRPGNRNEHTGFGGGWDMIISAAWAQPIWLSLIMWGARSGGLRESNSIAFESGQPNFLLPDTVAGKQEEKNISNECRNIFFKKPPNKRVNYNKFSIASPFECNWKLLISNWNHLDNQPVEDFFVLRDDKVLRSIQEALNSKSRIPEILDTTQNCLIPVRLKLKQKGLCKPFAVICLPRPVDLKKEPVEPKKVDVNEIKRKELRCEHKTLLKRLKQRRKRAKNNGKIISIDKEMLERYRNKMKELWLPPATEIRKSCCRDVLGFITTGDFSFLEGRSKAVGYIAIGALHALMSSNYRNTVLVRNTDANQYRIATIEVICK